VEQRRLDELARQVAAVPSRRSMIRTALGSVLALGGVGFGATRAEAGAGCKIAGRKCHRDTQCCTLKCQRRRCRR
jgi:hypothetical protein